MDDTGPSMSGRVVEGGSTAVQTYSSTAVQRCVREGGLQGLAAGEGLTRCKGTWGCHEANRLSLLSRLSSNTPTANPLSSPTVVDAADAPAVQGTLVHAAARQLGPGIIPSLLARCYQLTQLRARSVKNAKGVLSE